jgi:hypothetical protein
MNRRNPIHLRKVLIGLISLPLFAQGGADSPGAEAGDGNSAKLRTMIEAAPKTPTRADRLGNKAIQGLGTGHGFVVF